MTKVDRRNSLSLVLGIGLAAGFLSGLFGVGGGVLVVPALTLLVGMEPRIANGTSLGAVLPISISSLITYQAHGHVDWHMAMWIAAGSLIGAAIGTRLLQVVSRHVLGYLFVVILIATAVRLFFPVNADGRGTIEALTAIGLVVIGIITGTLAGLLGIGGGVVLVPMLVLIFSEFAVLAKGTSVAVIIPTSLMGTWRNWKVQNVDLRVSAIVGLAGVVSAIAGGIIADKLDQDLSNAMFAILVSGVAIKMLFDLRSQRNVEFLAA